MGVEMSESEPLAKEIKTEQPSTSEEPVNAEHSATALPDEDPLLIDPYVPFECSICHHAEKCLFSELKTIDGYYPAPVYFMRDPFTPRPKVKGRKPLLSDFLVLGSPCHLCSQPVCFDKGCSVHFGHLFCGLCIAREKRRFPEQVIQVLLKAQMARVKEEPKATE